MTAVSHTETIRAVLGMAKRGILPHVWEVREALAELDAAERALETAREAIERAWELCHWESSTKAEIAAALDAAGVPVAAEPEPAAVLPPELARVLRDPTIVVSRDQEIRLADGRTLHEHLEEWRNAPSNTASAGVPVAAAGREALTERDGTGTGRDSGESYAAGTKPETAAPRSVNAPSGPVTGKPAVAAAGREGA